jgi:L-aminopeptidase/D-esterase-like protein
VTDVRLPDGFACGHWTDRDRWTGCTVLLAPPGAVAGGEVRGGGPGTRESDLLSPLTSTPGPEALLLTGGSAFGLAAADGVARWLVEAGRGFATPAGRVPLVSAAVLYDLALGGGPAPGVADPGRDAPGAVSPICDAPGLDRPAGASTAAHPDAAAGHAACVAAGHVVQRGSVGAGTGATVGKVLGPSAWMRGGLGAASAPAGDATVVAIAAVNPIGDVLGSDGGVLAGVRGGRTSAELIATGAASPPIERENTTLVCVCTDARLTKLEAHLVARAMAAGVARAVSPCATAFDGDFTACIASGAVDVDATIVSVVAAEATSAAIRDAVLTATDAPGCPAVTGS